jgi:hypothetical protein
MLTGWRVAGAVAASVLGGVGADGDADDVPTAVGASFVTGAAT